MSFEFANEIFGGAIPRQFVPAVEKGIVESAVRGYLAGYPVVDFKVTVFDGSYHDVDSNEMSFKMAGRIAFQQSHGTGQAVAAGTGHESGDQDPRRVCGSSWAI